MLDIEAFASAAVSGVPLVLFVVGLVEWLKRFGVQGAALNIAAMLIGLVFGGGYMIAQAVPADFAGWFGTAVYGLALGLIASGIYDAAKSVLAAVFNQSKPPGTKTGTKPTVIR